MERSDSHSDLESYDSHNDVAPAVDVAVALMDTPHQMIRCKFKSLKLQFDLGVLDSTYRAVDNIMYRLPRDYLHSVPHTAHPAVYRYRATAPLR